MTQPQLPAGTRWLGVVGGMGPLAAGDFLMKLAAATPATRDQEQIPVLLYGDCATPDRSAAMMAGGENPLPALLRAVDFLCAAGASSIAIPCNSAHYWYDDMRARSTTPIFNIADASLARVREVNPGIENVGVLSTLGTAEMGIYSSRIVKQGIRPIISTRQEFDAWITPAIAAIKANRLPEATELLDKAARALFSRGAGAVILGCTEIPLGMVPHLTAEPRRYVDSTQSLAAAVVASFRP